MGVALIATVVPSSGSDEPHGERRRSIDGRLGVAPSERDTFAPVCKVAIYPALAMNWTHCLVHQAQSCCRTLRHGLLHPHTIRLRPFVVTNQYNAVVLHLEDVVSDGFADAVSGALREVDLDPHHYSDLEGLHDAGVVPPAG
jgi:hypothetical protein